MSGQATNQVSVQKLLEIMGQQTVEVYFLRESVSRLSAELASVRKERDALAARVSEGGSKDHVDEAGH